MAFWCAEKKGRNLLTDDKGERYVDGEKDGYKGKYREEVKREQKRVPEKRNEYKGKGEFDVVFAWLSQSLDFFDGTFVWLFIECFETQVER